MKELGPHKQERASGPSSAWPCPRRVLEGSPGAGRSPHGPVAGRASRQRCLRLCRSVQGCGALTAWPSAPLTTAQPSGLHGEGQGAPCRAGPAVDLLVDSRPHALMFLLPGPRLRTWSYFCLTGLRLVSCPPPLKPPAGISTGPCQCLHSSRESLTPPGGLSWGQRPGCWDA